MLKFHLIHYLASIGNSQENMQKTRPVKFGRGAPSLATNSLRFEGMILQCFNVLTYIRIELVPSERVFGVYNAQKTRKDPLVIARVEDPLNYRGKYYCFFITSKLHLVHRMDHRYFTVNRLR